MLAYVLRRLGSSIPTLFLIVTISFFLIRVAPGGPFDLEQALNDTILQNLRRLYRLDEPLWKQYLLYLQGLTRFDFGPSFSSQDMTVGQLFAKGLPVSITLGSLALLLAIVVGMTLGVIAALRQNQAADYAVVATAAAGITVPTFVTAPLFQVAFGLWLAWLPVGGWNDGSVRNIVLPVVVLALPQMAVVARLTRAAMIETMRANHIRTLRAQGLSNATIIRHALRSAALPVVSYLGPAAAALLTGSVVVETIFGLPGIGRYFVEGALNRDYTLVMGTVVVVAVFVILFNLIVDIAYAALDPRVRYQ
jgi:oligopeptide transport system permease protein